MTRPIRCMLVLLCILFLLGTGCSQSDSKPTKEASAPLPASFEPSTQAPAVKIDVPLPPTPAPTPEPTPVPTATPTPTPTPTPVPTPTPELITNDMLDSGMFDALFDDVVFVGDSITWTFSHYVRNVRQKEPAFLGDAKFLATVSMSVRVACRDRVTSGGVNFNYRGRDTSVTDGINRSEAKRAFVLLGLNDLAIQDWELVRTNFGKLIDAIHEKCPGVQVIITGVFPVTDKFCDKAGQEWNSFNIGLEQVCKDHDADFFSFAEKLMAPDGQLNLAYCGDGKCHLNIPGEEIWVRELRKYILQQTRTDILFEDS